MGLNRRKGTLTIEAALVVPIFVCAVMSIAYLMNLVYLHELIDFSLNEAGNEIAEYSYIYSKSGMKTIADKVVTSTEAGAETFSNDSAEIINAYTVIGEFEGSNSKSNIDDIKNSVNTGDLAEQVKNSGDDIYDVVDNVVTDPEREGVSMVCFIGNLLLENADEKITSAIAYVFMKKSLSINGVSADERLKKFGVVDGIKGLDFHGSSLFMEDNNRAIKLETTYSVEIPLPIKFIPKFKIRQVSYIRGWCGN
ncbi:MAG: TadE/TadG family type IV pilus assembly protein [Clostridiaceae bacterium]